MINKNSIFTISKRMYNYTYNICIKMEEYGIKQIINVVAIIWNIDNIL